MRSIIDSEEIAQRRQRAMRDVGEVLIFVDGVNAAGEVVHTNYVLSEGPGSDPIGVFLEFGYRWLGPDDARYQTLNIVAFVGSEFLEMLVDGLKLDDLGPDGVKGVLREVAEIIDQAKDKGVPAVDAVAAWEKERAAPAV
jgi:hypothetical protein